MSLSDKINLKLIGKNKENLKVISAYLQDSIVVVKDIAFLKRSRIFIMIVNRFMWDDVEKGIFRENKRIKCAVKFEEVIKVKSKNINQKNKKKSLEILAIECNEILNDIHEMKIFFSGNGVITIVSEAVDVMIHDFGKPWSVKYAPIHKI